MGNFESFNSETRKAYLKCGFAKGIINVKEIKGNFLTETFELPGVVPYPDDGRLATDHRLPSAFLMLANANWFGDTFGESIGDTI